MSPRAQALGDSWFLRRRGRKLLERYEGESKGAGASCVPGDQGLPRPG
ncbi:MAG: hypothetical protein M3Q29_03495 [Chloroflexota bacterium]|nr:hypothetical protein [Chloroflexota bacterium]